MISNIELSRRDFLRGVAYGGAALALVGCNTSADRLRNQTPKLSSVPSPEALVDLPPLTQEHVSMIAQKSIHNFNKVLGLSINESEAVSKVVVGNTQQEFADYIMSDPAYNPKFRPENYGAATTTTYDANGLKTIHINRPTLESITSKYPRTQEGAQGRDQFVEDMLDHEFVHWSSIPYQSELLNKIVFENLLASVPDFKNKKIRLGFVEGAKITCIVDGAQKATYKDLEEAEALLIAQYVVDRDDKKIELVDNIMPDDIGEGPQFMLLTKLLNKMAKGASTSDLIVTLAHLRRTNGGREQWGHMVAEAFGKNNNLEFAMGVLMSVDQGNQEMFSDLTGIK